MRKDWKLLRFISNLVDNPAVMARCKIEKNFEIITVYQSPEHVLQIFVWQHKKNDWYSCVMGDVTLTTVKGLPTRKAALVALCGRLDALTRRYHIGDDPQFAKVLCEGWAKTHKATMEALCNMGALTVEDVANCGAH